MSTGYLPYFLPEDVLLESFTFPFFDANFSINAASMARLFHDQVDPTPRRGKRGLYIHIPFCESICSFCPFIKSVGSEERIASYLDALHREIDVVASTRLLRSWSIDSVYIGGGTPSVLSENQIVSLLNKVRDSFAISTEAEITIEVEPKSASEAFCSAAASAGANRLSFGVQTLNPKLRKMMNLTATLEQIQNLSRVSREMFRAANFDMIVGYPGQTYAEVEADMAHALDLDVGNISVYPLDYLMTLPSFLDRIRRGDLPPPLRSEERWEMFHLARSEILRRYHAQNMYFFSEPGMPGCQYMFDIVYGGYYDEFIGLGVGAYSMIRGLSYANTQSEDKYVRLLMEEKTVPVEMATPGHAYEKHYVYFGKRTVADMTEAIDLGIERFVQPKFDALHSAGFVEQRDSKYHLTDAGERIYARIMVGFLSDGQRRLYDRVCSRMRHALNWDFDGARSRDRASVQGAAVKHTMAKTAVGSSAARG
jgi:oxygen-independent coproporphyrinogen-3 oxidase